MSSRRLLFLVIFSLAVVPRSFAQDDDPCDWGYLFNWKPDFDIGKVQIGTVYDNTNTKVDLMGIGMEKFLNNRWGLQLGLDLGIDNSTREDTVRTVDNNTLDMGVRAQMNYYFRGKDKRISPYVGGWLSYSKLTSKFSDKPKVGTSFETEYNSSTIGIGATGGIFWQPWSDMDFDFGFNYNIGAMISPQSTLKVTTGTQTVETNGPSRLVLGDCGGQITARFSF